MVLTLSRPQKVGQQKVKTCNEALRDGPLKNLWGGGGPRSTKKNSRKGKSNKKKIMQAN